MDFKRRWRQEWEATNPTLRKGEPGVEIDTNRLKVGDGRSPWTELPFIGGRKAGTIAVPEDELSTDEHIVIEDTPTTIPNFGPALLAHIKSDEPHPAYDDGPSLVLLYENAKV